MATNYPASLDSYSTKVDGVTDVLAAHVNDLQDAVVAIETELGTQPRHTTTSAPTVNDDSGDGYSVGTIWTDTTNDKVYICIDNTSTAAIWLELEINYTEFLTADDFGKAIGSTAIGTITDGANYGFATWRLDDSSTESIGAAFEYKGGRGGSTIYVDLWYAMESATSGDVRLHVGANAFADGEDSAVTPTINQQIITVPGTVKYLDRVTFTASETYVVGDLIQISVMRPGGLGTDTASGDCHIIAAVVRFA